MKLILNDILKYDNAYKIVSQEKLPIKVTYKLMKFHSLIEKDLEFYSQNFNTIVEENALRDENGLIKYDEKTMNILIDPDKISKAEKEINNLLNMEIEIENEKYLIDIDELDNINISIDNLEGLKILLK